MGGGVLRGIFLGGMHKSKVAQHPKVCRKLIGVFLFEHSMCSKSAFFDFYDFLRISNPKFSKANLGYLDTFFGGMLESKLALK